MSVILGRTFQIECQATGFPVPFINWRLNWGHVCEEPRCTSTNENGRGILTVTDARITDAGAYSCEAINSKGRVFAIPDAIISVRYPPQDITLSPPTRPTVTRPQTPSPVPSRPCDSYGSYNQYPPCQCRPYIGGTYCDQCPAGRFHLIIENRNSICAQCYCSGFQVNCASSGLNYASLESDFESNEDEWTINNNERNLKATLNVRDRSIQFTEFDDFQGQDMFFYAPSKFLGNKVASYAGNFSFTIRYEGPNSARPKKLEVRLSGPKGDLVHREARQIYAYQDRRIVILLVEVILD